MKKIISVVGARPNFMKMAPVHRAFQKYHGEVQHLICHTGQHYDDKMSKVFFDDLELPKPDFYLGVGSGTHAQQTAKVMVEFEKVLNEQHPDLIIVYGDVNSTIACALTAVKLGIKVAHVEAGLRSFDRSMPEEINRVLTDSISDFLFVSEKSGIENLKHEGIGDKKIFFVGNVMIDSLIHFLPKIEKSAILNNYGLAPEKYIVVTLHRPSNVDDAKNLSPVVEFLNSVAKQSEIIFPVHPRTKLSLERNGFKKQLASNIKIVDPIGYLDFVKLMKESRLVITDSGGIQEETTYLGVQCITLRDNTERPITTEIGTNHLIGTDLNAVALKVVHLLNGEKKVGEKPELWDGKASDRITAGLVNSW